MPRSPEVWLDRLAGQLAGRQALIERYEAYYSGEHPLVFATEPFREAFGQLFGPFADNWCETVVSATEERLNVVGFRFGDSPEADNGAWEIWQANQMDSEAQLAHTEALICSVAYALVWPGTTVPRITVEHPSQVITAHDPRDRRRTVAALKTYVDDDGVQVAYLYLPGTVYRYRSAPADEGRVVDAGKTVWLPDDRPDAEDPPEQPNPFVDVVPMVCVPNKPRLIRPPRSELAVVIPMQDMINKAWADLMVASERTAATQRYILGGEPPIDPVTKQPKKGVFNPREPYWWIPDPDDGERVRVGQFDAGKLSEFIGVIETGVQHIASQTRTPPHYLNPGADRLSGESIKSSESGLVSKVRRKMVPFGEAWEQVLRLAFVAAGEASKAEYLKAETIWGDPEIKSEAQAADAALKRKELGVPEAQLQEDLGYSPTQIERFAALRLEEQLFARPLEVTGG